MRMSVRANITAALLVACGLAVAQQAAAQEPLVIAPRVAGEGAILDPAAPFWQQARPLEVRMLPQMMVAPQLVEPSVQEVEVRAVHNGEWLGVRLKWRDTSKNDWIRTDEFGDQVAIQFPVRPDGELPSPMMGHPKGQVSIMQWRAPFQRDLLEGEPGVRDLYPNALVDVYPDQVLQAVDARAYTGAMGVDNPISRPFQSPVLDQMAEGWGSLTVKPMQQAHGHGVWENGEWRVVMTRPMVRATANDPDLRPGIETMIALAVWDGEQAEVGARKAWSSWIPFRIAK
jgi:DMSO reductase family type II enzyme heme b subunit